MLTFGFIIAILCIYHWAVFIKIPSTIAQTAEYGNHDSAIRQLKVVLAMPSLIGSGVKLMTKFLLGDRLVLIHRYDEAAQTLQDILKAGIPQSFELHVRKRLADSFDGLGKEDEAQAERVKVGDIASTMPTDPAACIVQAEVLHRNQQYDQEVTVLERALSFIPITNSTLRLEFTSRLAISWTIAGNATKAVAYAEKTLDMAPSNPVRLTMHQMAALAYTNLGKLDQASEHADIAVDLSKKLDDDSSETRSLSFKVGILRCQGLLDESLKLAEDISTRPGNMDYMVRLQHHATLKLMGRFEEALEVLDYELEDTQDDIPMNSELKHVTECAIMIAKSEVYGELGQIREAWDLMQRGQMGFEDKKMRLHCDSLTAWLRAYQQKNDDALRLIEKVDTKIDTLELDRGTKIDLLARIADAANIIGDYLRAHILIQKLLELEPSPGYMPIAYYLLGEFHRGSGNDLEAIIAYRKSVDLKINSYHAHRSMQRLSELSV